MRVVSRLAWTLLIFGIAPVGVLFLAYNVLAGDPSSNQERVSLLTTAAWLTLFASVGLPLLLVTFALICGDRRWLLSLIFPPLATLSVLGLACLILLQGALAIGGAALYFTTHSGGGFIGRIAIGVAIGVGATSIALIGASVKMLRTTYIDATGVLLAPENAPRLFDHVRKLAAKLQAPAPKQIILGLDPNFYVTTAQVRLLGGAQSTRGETLYVSTPLARLMSEQEFNAVIGHELGHFRGKDTIYSTRFAPAFAALEHALVSMQGDEESGPHVFALPALITLGLLHDIFAVNIAQVSRKREFEADRAGVECSSNRASATALLKATWYGLCWNFLIFNNTERLTRLDIADNLSLEFPQQAAARNVQEPELSMILAAQPPHPVDTHPPVESRLAALGFATQDFSAADLAPSEPSASSLIDELEKHETVLTTIEHQQLIAARAGALGERDQRATLVQAAALLGAQLAKLEEGTHPGFLDLAEERGRSVMRDFDANALRAFYAKAAETPDFGVTASVIGSLVSEEGKFVLLRYLDALAAGGGLKAVDERVAALKQSWRSFA